MSDRNMFQGTEEEENERKPVLDRLQTRTPMFIYVISVFSAIGGFLFGYDTGVVSGAMILIRDKFELNHLWQEYVVSSTIAAAWLFSLLAGFMTDRYGRKPVIIVASFVFTCGGVLMGIATNKEMLLGGRLVVGVGIGMASMVVPMYIAEASPSHIRGRLVTVNACFITGGQFCATLVDGAFSSDAVNGWRYMLGLAGIPSCIQFFGFLFMPESPRWLISKGRYPEAISVLRKLHGPTANIEEEFEAIKMSFLESERERQEHGGSGSFIIIQVLRNPMLRNALIVGCLLMIFQQISGINTVMYYSATILEMSGIDKSKAIWLASATAAVNFAFTFVGLYLVERSGRRLLTLGSLAGVVLSLAVLAVGFQVSAYYSPMINETDPSAVGTDCATYTSCSSCVYSTQCGYCFEKGQSENGTCLPANADRTDESTDGPCSNSTYLEDHVWGYEWCPSNYSWMVIFGLLLYLFFFAPGMGPMPWTINSEIYPLWARGTCYSVATSFCWMFNFIVSMTFLTLTENITKYGTFWLYAGLALVGWVIFFLFLPETKGKALEEVEMLFAHPWWKDATTSGDRKVVQAQSTNTSAVSNKSVTGLSMHPADNW